MSQDLDSCWQPPYDAPISAGMWDNDWAWNNNWPLQAINEFDDGSPDGVVSPDALWAAARGAAGSASVRARNPHASGNRPKSHQNVPKHMNLVQRYGESPATRRPQDPKTEATTLMVRNVPNSYSRKALMAEMDALGFQGLYDFVYLPIDCATQWNVGYAFVNFEEPASATAFTEAMENYRFRNCRSAKRRLARVSPAHVQGVEANLDHLRSTAVLAAQSPAQRPWFRHKVSVPGSEDTVESASASLPPAVVPHGSSFSIESRRAFVLSGLGMLGGALAELLAGCGATQLLTVGCAGTHASAWAWLANAPGLAIEMRRQGANVEGGRGGLQGLSTVVPNRDVVIVHAAQGSCGTKCVDALEILEQGLCFLQAFPESASLVLLSPAPGVARCALLDVWVQLSRARGRDVVSAGVPPPLSEGLIPVSSGGRLLAPGRRRDWSGLRSPAGLPKYGHYSGLATLCRLLASTAPPRSLATHWHRYLGIRGRARCQLRPLCASSTACGSTISRHRTGRRASSTDVGTRQRWLCRAGRTAESPGPHLGSGTRLRSLDSGPCDSIERLVSWANATAAAHATARALLSSDRSSDLRQCTTPSSRVPPGLANSATAAERIWMSAGAPPFVPTGCAFEPSSIGLALTDCPSTSDVLDYEKLNIDARMPSQSTAPAVAVVQSEQHQALSANSVEAMPLGMDWPSLSAGPGQRTACKGSGAGASRAGAWTFVGKTEGGQHTRNTSRPRSKAAPAPSQGCGVSAVASVVFASAVYSRSDLLMAREDLIRARRGPPGLVDGLSSGVLLPAWSVLDTNALAAAGAIVLRASAPSARPTSAHSALDRNRTRRPSRAAGMPPGLDVSGRGVSSRSAGAPRNRTAQRAAFPQSQLSWVPVAGAEPQRKASKDCVRRTRLHAPEDSCKDPSGTKLQSL